MGYLVDTTPTLSFSETMALAKYIKEHGIIQFLNLYKKFKDFEQKSVLWGDEMELHLLNIDPETKLPRLQLNTEYMFDSLKDEPFVLEPEYGAWMLETIPVKPYDLSGDPNIPLQNFKARRQGITALCKNGDVLYAGTVFPLLNVGEYFVSREKKSEDESKSEEECKSDVSETTCSSMAEVRKELLHTHPRFLTIVENAMLRRGEDLKILVPVFVDENTSMDKTAEEPHPGFIHMSEALFGTGSASMQTTFGTKNIEEARYLVDQLSVLSSIVLPLSAASAVFKGKLSDVDTRWSLLSQCLDCRTAEERDSNHPKFQPKTRWSSISRYISNRPQCKEEYNDIHCPLDDDMMSFAKERAKELGLDLDEGLVKHLGFIFLQDPLIVYSDRVCVDDMKLTNHWENLQSSNWNNVRFKPPPNFDSEVGWRVELRTMETQLTVEESTALAMFTFFIAHMILEYDYNFYIPISKVDENMKRAQKRDAILTEKFWFRKNLEKESPDEWIELTIDEILHGKENTFIGLFPLIYKFCKDKYRVDIQGEWKKRKESAKAPLSPQGENMKYFEILSQRARGERPTIARGERPTIARWIRDFVRKHPKYQKDSIVSAEIATDLIDAITLISDGKKTYDDFL